MRCGFVVSGLLATILPTSRWNSRAEVSWVTFSGDVLWSPWSGVFGFWLHDMVCVGRRRCSGDSLCCYKQEDWREFMFIAEWLANVF